MQPSKNPNTKPDLSNLTINLDDRFIEFLKTPKKDLSIQVEYLEELVNRSIRKLKEK